MEKVMSAGHSSASGVPTFSAQVNVLLFKNLTQHEPLRCSYDAVK
jgi:hypothetical protein